MDRLQITKKEYKNQKLKKPHEIHAIFQHNMTYGNIQDFIRRTAFDKILRNKAFTIAENPKYDRYQRVLAWMVYK